MWHSRLIRRVRGMAALVCALLLTSCEGTSFSNSVPAYPVRVVIDTRTLFVDFTPENTNAYITVDQDGYKENDRFVVPVTVMDAWGYAGVLAYVSLGGYVAFDLGCPYCAGRGTKSQCYMDGIYAVCPVCGEQYEVASGYALPQKGLSKETLRPLAVQAENGKLTITQRK